MLFGKIKNVLWLKEWIVKKRFLFEEACVMKKC